MITHSISSFHGQIHAESIWVGLRIVYDKDQFDENTARKILEKQIKDLDDVYAKIEIHFEVEFVAGTSNDFVVEGGVKSYKSITEGARSGYINGYLYRDEKEIYSYNYTSTGTRQMFFRMPNKGYNNPFNIGAISHELGHVFGLGVSLGVSTFRMLKGTPDYVRDGITYVALKADNLVADANIDLTILWLRNGYISYGNDWVDDYRTVKKVVDKPWNLSKLGAKAAREVQYRVPTICDIYRVAAKTIRDQTK